MKIVVIGGSGLIGRKLVDRLRQRRHEAMAASPASGVDTITGQGLAEALAGAQVVVDVANSPSLQAVLSFFQTSGRNVLAAERGAGVRHHLALSVVGTDRLLESGYFRAKMAQEELIKAGKVPDTILRSTQFFDFLGGIADGANGTAVRLSPAPAQPIASDDVADALAELALGAHGTTHAGAVSPRKPASYAARPRAAGGLRGAIFQPTRSVAMDKSTAFQRPDLPNASSEDLRGTSFYASCGVCEREVPVAAVREASDYMAHFCGLECYARWRNQSL